MGSARRVRFSLDLFVLLDTFIALFLSGFCMSQRGRCPSGRSSVSQFKNLH